MRVSIGVQAVPPHPDPDQIGVEWIDATKLREVRFYPKELVPRLIEIASGFKINPCYVGDMN